MKDILIDGKLQIMAAVALLDHSRLVRWNPEENRFIPVPMEEFDLSWRRDIDPIFGRLLCWIVFSAGAEFLAKGICLVSGIEIRRPGKVPAYPTGDLKNWAHKFLTNDKSCDTLPVTYFGVLGSLTKNKATVPAPLEHLCSVMNATSAEKDLLLAAYKLLTQSIRNRDAHAFVANVRGQHFGLVSNLFTPVFNILVSWLPGDPETMNRWRTEAKEFILSL
jgi:hypothetical protein